ncbi:MAG: transposase [Phycisphaerales bacterium]|nr:transposase [Phycisphaerales bacterium]
MPHYDGRSAVQHVTVHLADSLPQTAIERIDRSLALLSEDQRNVERRKRLHEWIDAGHGQCVLGQPQIAEMVQNTFLHFDNDRYQLHAWVVMPNHFHVLFELLAGWTLAKIVASWKKFTARKIRDSLRITNGQANREIGDPGNANLPIGQQNSSPVWHKEYWDRYMRNERHYEQTVAYIHNNPVAAGLAPDPAAWRWSSATAQKTNH